MTTNLPGNEGQPEAKNPARPWQLATGALALGLVFCLGILSQGTQQGAPQATVTVTAAPGEAASP